jgi:hypothetical protein
MKRLGWLVIAAMVLFGAAYFASPFLAWRTIRDSVRNADEREMARTIDLPSVRGGLRGQLKALFAGRISADPRLKGNPYASLGLKLLPALVARMTDAYLTPEAIAVMVSQGRPPLKPGETVVLGAATHLSVRYAYLGLDAVRVTASGEGQGAAPLQFLLQRRGLFTWRLVRITLPPAAFTPAADRGAARWRA